MRPFLLAVMVLAAACARPAEPPEPVAAPADAEQPAPAPPTPPLFDAAALGIGAQADLIAAGRAAATTHCAACHGLDAEQSLDTSAPPLRFLLSFYPRETVITDLRAGIMAGHGAAVTIAVPAGEMDALLAYLVSIQQAPL